MTERGIGLQTVAVVVGYWFGLSFAVAPLADVADLGLAVSLPNWLTTATGLVVLATAITVRRRRPAVAVETTGAFGVVTWLGFGLLRAVVPLGDARVHGSLYPSLAAALVWLAALAFAYVLTFGGGWRDLKSAIRDRA